MYGYDTYDSCVVCALDEDDAKSFHPSGKSFVENTNRADWARYKHEIICREIGEANLAETRGVIIASFNAC
jgi:hypothetical protein